MYGYYLLLIVVISEDYENFNRNGSDVGKYDNDNSNDYDWLHITCMYIHVLWYRAICLFHNWFKNVHCLREQRNIKIADNGAGIIVIPAPPTRLSETTFLRKLTWYHWRENVFPKIISWTCPFFMLFSKWPPLEICKQLNGDNFADFHHRSSNEVSKHIRTAFPIQWYGWNWNKMKIITSYYDFSCTFDMF